MTYSLTYTQGTTKEAGTISDTSVWGGANPARNTRYNILLFSRNDKSGTRSYLPVVNTDPNNVLSWAVSSTMDSWHQATLLVFQLWNSGTAYVASVNAIYYAPTTKFYRCISNNTNVAPDSGSGPTKWTEITDFTTIQQGYTNVDVKDFNFSITSRIAIFLGDELYETIIDKFLAQLQPEEAVEFLNSIATLEGIKAKELDGKFNEMEEIIRAMADAMED